MSEKKKKRKEKKTPTPKATGKRLHNYLIRDLNFNVLHKFIRLYERDEKIYLLFNKLLKESGKKENGGNPFANFSKNELATYNKLGSDLRKQLATLIAYCYPKMQTLKLDTDESDRVTFNINVK